jgi:hypothetical protein
MLDLWFGEFDKVSQFSIYVKNKMPFPTFFNMWYEQKRKKESGPPPP